VFVTHLWYRAQVLFTFIRILIAAFKWSRVAKSRLPMLVPRVSIFEPTHEERGFFNLLPYLVRSKQMQDQTGAHFPKLKLFVQDGNTLDALRPNMSLITPVIACIFNKYGLDNADVFSRGSKLQTSWKNWHPPGNCTT
jgi:hypothetical protein